MRTSITLSDEVAQRLQEYIRRQFGVGRRVLSLVVEQAIKEFLEKHKEENKGENDRCNN